MMIPRRNFIASLLALPIAHTLDIEKLLWLPGVKRFFIPPPPIAITLLEFAQRSNNVECREIIEILTSRSVMLDELHQHWEWTPDIVLVDSSNGLHFTRYLEW